MKVLVVLYYWPPSGGPGVQRGLKLCRHLREEGIEPVVVTVPPETYDAPEEYEVDRTLADEVPRDLRVIHTAPPGGRALRGLLARTHLLSSAASAFPGAWFERQAGWGRPLAAALAAAVKAERPAAILTSSQPYVVHLAGRAAALATHVPWVADFRDPWTQAWGRTWPSHRALAWEERREEEVLADADRVVANTPGCRAQLLARRPWLDGRKVAVVPNGYDPEDFRTAAPASAGTFRVVHSGAFRARPATRDPPSREPTGTDGTPAEPSLRDRLRLSGPRPVPYDLSTHSPETLLRAAAELSGRVGDRDLRLRFVGRLDAAWVARAEQLGVAQCVEAHGYLPHREAVSEVLGADLLFLPTITREDGGSVANVPAKTYEYLGSGRAIAALAGPGDVADLLADPERPRPRCRVLAPNDVPGLAALLRDTADGALPAVPPDPEDAWPWRRRETARRMAEALRSAVAGKTPLARPAVPTIPARDGPRAP